MANTNRPTDEHQVGITNAQENNPDVVIADLTHRMNGHFTAGEYAEAAGLALRITELSKDRSDATIMNPVKTSDEVMRELNDRAKAQGRFLATSFSEIPRTSGSLLDRPDTAESDERIRKMQEYIARARNPQAAASEKA